VLHVRESSGENRGTPAALRLDTHPTKELSMTTNEFVSISSSDLDNVTGGGKIGTAVKVGEKIAHGAESAWKGAKTAGKAAWGGISKGIDAINAGQSVVDAGKAAWGAGKAIWGGDDK
jgi:hypothetical protein